MNHAALPLASRRTRPDGEAQRKESRRNLGRKRHRGMPRGSDGAQPAGPDPGVVPVAGRTRAPLLQETTGPRFGDRGPVSPWPAGPSRDRGRDSAARWSRPSTCRRRRTGCSPTTQCDCGTMPCQQFNSTIGPMGRSTRTPGVIADEGAAGAALPLVAVVHSVRFVGFNRRGDAVASTVRP
jgi:hypothetical protein